MNKQNQIKRALSEPEAIEYVSRLLEEEEFFRLQSKMARRARKKGIFTERQVERIVFEGR